jgi:hypothetical protein
MTPLMEKTPSKPALQEHPSTIQPCDSVPQTPPAYEKRAAFKIGGSEEADLDSNMDTKDLGASSGEIPLLCCKWLVTILVLGHNTLFVNVYILYR